MDRATAEPIYVIKEEGGPKEEWKPKSRSAITVDLKVVGAKWFKDQLTGLRLIAEEMADEIETVRINNLSGETGLVADSVKRLAELTEHLRNAGR
jgi:hypothetical protein